MVEMCFEAHRYFSSPISLSIFLFLKTLDLTDCVLCSAAQVAGRQKIKLDDIKFACRKNPTYLGKIHDVIDKKDGIDKARKTLDVNDDKIIKTGGKAIEEDLGEVDDVELETATAGGKSTGTRR